MIISEYERGKHLSYADLNNPVDTLIHAIPGVKSNQYNFF
jgi:hypothetical protein